MNNQTDHTKQEKRFELEKRMSELEVENKALREEIKTIHVTYQTKDRERLQLLEGIINGTTNTITEAEAFGNCKVKSLTFATYYSTMLSNAIWAHPMRIRT
jgi:transcription initiation factor TFIID subunit TAF12